jgi:site-specific recombinase XerC
MIALPLDLVESFERKLDATWSSRSVSWAKRRDALVIGLGLCGLRWEETRRVRRCDLRPVSFRLSVRTAKGGVGRSIYVGRSWTAAALLLRDGCLGGDLLFVTRNLRPLAYKQVLRRVRDWTRQHFGEAYSFHCLRHTAAVRMHRATGDVLAVQRYLGHRSLQWTSVYLAGVEGTGPRGMPSFVTSGDVAALTVFDPAGLLQQGGKMRA